MDTNEEIFKGVKFSDLMHDVYHNSKKKDRQINQLIAQLQPLIRNASDATVIVPLIKEYLEVSVKNDDHLVKLTAIVQRYISTKQTLSGADSLISDDEKAELIRIAESAMNDELENEIEKLNSEATKIKERVANSKESNE